MSSPQPSDLFDLGPPGPCEQVTDRARTLGELFLERVEATPDKASVFFKRRGQWQRRTWADFSDRARRVSALLLERGLERGDCVAVVGPTAPDWIYQEIGSQLIGMVTLGIYPRQAPEQMRYLLEHSEAKIVFVADREELATVLEAARDLPSLETIVPWEAALAEKFADRDPRIVSPAGLRGEDGAREPLDDVTVAEFGAAVDPDATAMLIYTSGTTGPPKGAMLSHRNVLAMAASLRDVFVYQSNDLLMNHLPMAHATQRNLGFYGRVAVGVANAYASSIGAVLSEMQEARPTVFGSVPRIFEKAFDRVQSEMAKKPPAVRKIFAWADRIGRERGRLVREGKAIPGWLAFRYRLAERLVFEKIRAAFGGRVRACITGAAPISVEILEFFWGMGMPIFEGYGMTEATVVTHVNRAGHIRLGSVGKAIPPLEHKIADDGEVLMRGSFVFQGYFKNPEATAETVIDGWLHSGDIGRIDDDGYLFITDRKKHLIVTAGGKNVAPANVERAIKNQSPLISQVHAHGDRRKFVSALLAPSPIETLEWGAQNGVIEPAEAEERVRELMADPSARSPELAAAMAKVVEDARFLRLFVEPVQRGNALLANVEKVKRFAVLDRDFSQEEGELTPTMKMKRKVIETKHAAIFERLYDDPAFGLDA